MKSFQSWRQSSDTGGFALCQILKTIRGVLLWNGNSVASPVQEHPPEGMCLKADEQISDCDMLISMEVVQQKADLVRTWFDMDQLTPLETSQIGARDCHA